MKYHVFHQNHNPRKMQAPRRARRRAVRYDPGCAAASRIGSARVTPALSRFEHAIRFDIEHA
jgi:hypothetical protein